MTTDTNNTITVASNDVGTDIEGLRHDFMLALRAALQGQGPDVPAAKLDVARKTLADYDAQLRWQAERADLEALKVTDELPPQRRPLLEDGTPNPAYRKPRFPVEDVQSDQQSDQQVGDRPRRQELGRARFSPE